jgi:integrase-like protein
VHPLNRHHRYAVLLVTPSNKGQILRSLNVTLVDRWQQLRDIGGQAPLWRVPASEITSQADEQRMNLAAKGLTEHDKALPHVVFDQMRAHLHLLGEDGTPRNSIELLMHLGRRPEDQVNVPFDCLAPVTETFNGEEVTYSRLRYTDRLKDGKGGHLVDIPVFEAAARAIHRQQDWLRRTRPQWFDQNGVPLHPDLRLWPRASNNPDGTIPISASALNSWIREWTGKSPVKSTCIRRLPTIVGDDGKPFPLARVTAYALRHTFGQDLHDLGVPLDTIQRLMGHDHISTTQAYSRPSHQSQWEGMRSLERTRSARITGEGNVVLLPFPTTLAGHEQLTRAAMDCGGCADKGNIAQHVRGCKFGMECLNCFYFRASVADLPDLHRTRHRKAVALARAEARQTPRGLLGSATATKLKLEVERLDDLISQLETEITTTGQLTDDQRQSIWDTLERMERVDRELLTPLGATRGPVRALVDERTFHPLAAAETQATGAER